MTRWRGRSLAAAIAVMSVVVGCGSGDDAAVPVAGSTTAPDVVSTDPPVLDQSEEADDPSLGDEEVEAGDAPEPPARALRTAVTAGTPEAEGVALVRDQLAGVDLVIDVVGPVDTDVDLVVVSGSDVGALTDAAVATSSVLVDTGHRSTGAVQRQGVRLDLAPTAALTYDAVAARVALGEYEAIVVVGSADDPVRPFAIEALERRGAVVTVVDVDEPNSAADDLQGLVERVVGPVSGAAVVVASSEPAEDLVAAIGLGDPDAALFTTDWVVPVGSGVDLSERLASTVVVVRPATPRERPDAESPFTDQAAAIAHDAQVLAAVAAVAPESSSAGDPIAGLVEASRGGTPCSRPIECVALAGDGVDVDYDGLSGPLELNDDGSITSAWFAVDTLGSGVIELSDVLLHTGSV